MVELSMPTAISAPSAAYLRVGQGDGDGEGEGEGEGERAIGGVRAVGGGRRRERVR